MIGRRGFALLAVLWVIVALAAIVGLGAGSARLGLDVTANRLRLTRGRWAAQACLSIAEARWADHRLTDTATVDLGRRTTCAWHVEDPTSRLNINTTDRTTLVRLCMATGVRPTVVDSLLLRRPFADTALVRAALGGDTLLLSFLAVDGPGTVNANGAAPEVLGTLPGIDPVVVDQLVESRRVGRPVTSLDQLVSVAGAARPDLLAHYAELAGTLTFTPPQLLVTAQGWVEGSGSATDLHATIEVLVVSLPNRLAVIRRRMW